MLKILLSFLLIVFFPLSPASAGSHSDTPDPDSTAGKIVRAISDRVEQASSGRFRLSLTAPVRAEARSPSTSQGRS